MCGGLGCGGLGVRGFLACCGVGFGGWGGGFRAWCSVRSALAMIWWFGVWGLGHWGWGLLEYKSSSVGESLIALVEQLDQLVTTRVQGWLNNLVLSLVFNLI